MADGQRFWQRFPPGGDPLGGQCGHRKKVQELSADADLELLEHRRSLRLKILVPAGCAGRGDDRRVAAWRRGCRHLRINTARWTDHTIGLGELFAQCLSGLVFAQRRRVATDAGAAFLL
jgi:hypothetical protein